MEKKKLSKKVKIIIIIVALFLALILTAVTIIGVYLSKLNYGEEKLGIDEGNIEDINLPNGLNADNDILDNLDHNELWYHKDVLNILLIGRDLGGSDHYARADAMLVLSLNKVNNEINLASFSRAAYVSIPGVKNSRLGNAHSYGGAELVKETIELNYKIRIDNYISVDFSGFEKIVNIFGGVEVNLTKAEIDYLATYFPKLGITSGMQAGTHTLNGRLALEYCRIRSIDSDHNRTQRQRNVLLAIASKAKRMSVSQGLELLNAIFPLVNTDLKKSEIISHAVKAPSYFKMPVYNTVIPTLGPELVMVDGFEVLILDWENTRWEVHDFFYNEMVPENALKEAND